MAKSSPWRPAWSRPFIEEYDTLELDSPLKTGLPWAAISLFVFFAGSLALEIVTLIQQRTAIIIALVALSGFSLLWTAIFRPRTTSIVLALTSVSAIALQAFALISDWDNEESTSSRNISTINVAVSLIPFLIVINLPFRPASMGQSDIAKAYAEPSEKLRSPEDNLTLWQFMTFSWVSPLISLGKKRKLEVSDVWKLGYEFQHRHLHEAFRQLKGSVIRRLLRANWIDLAILLLLAFVELAAEYSQPLILQKLLQEMQRVEFVKGPALKYGALILVLQFVGAQSQAFSLWYGRRTYERSRGELIMMLYEKTLHRKIVGGSEDKKEDKDDKQADDTAALLQSADIAMPPPENSEGVEEAAAETETTPLLLVKPQAAPQKGFVSRILKPVIGVFTRTSKAPEKPEEKLPASMGKILNLMRNDVYEIAQRFWEVQILVSIPVGFVLSLVLCWRLMGPSVLLGVAVLGTSQGINIFVARAVRNREKIRRKHTDTRLQETSQYVEAIRHLRWYGWHQHWMKNITTARQSELNWKIIVSLWNIVLWIINALGADLMMFMTFLGYTAIFKNELRIDVAFPALELLSLLHQGLRRLPDLIVTFLNANVAINRIEDFMAEPDKEDNEKIGAEPVSEGDLELKEASFAWPGRTDNVLKNVTLTFSPGLHVVSGPVACGKSALLKALLGELDLTAGQLISHNGAIGYCAQNPWLQSMSIRDNIIFTSEYDEARYKKTIEACALVPDFANFKDGDRSAIGENGIGLSGGQKSRCALARAVYSSAKVLLLDDPLSSLDQQTAEFIVENCFKSDLVADRVMILVTHRLDLVRGIAEQRIHINDGEVHVNDADNDEDSSNGSTMLGQTDSEDKALEKTPEAIIEEPAAKKFEDDENREHGEVKLTVFWQYIKAGTFLGWFVLFAFALTGRATTLAEVWFVKEWGEAYNRAGPSIYTLIRGDMSVSTIQGRNPFDKIFDYWPNPADNIYPWLLGHLSIIVLQTFSYVGVRGGFMITTYCSAKSIFNGMLDKISSTTFHYYDITPTGRLMNRMTSDIGILDGGIAGTLFGMFDSSLSWISAILIIAALTPLFLLVSVVLSATFVLIFLRYLPTSQSLRRLEMASLSPLMSNFGALLEGLMTVRAFAAQTQFQDKVIKVVDTFQAMDHMYWANQGWLSYRFECLTATSTFLLTVIAIYSGLSPGLTAFALVSASRFVYATHNLCRQYGRVQLDFVSVERVVELLHLDLEDPGELSPPASWPRYGSDITFEDVTLRYAAHLDPALTSVSCTLPGGTTTAVTGRTGSGKSTLALSLLAILPPESGRILIDGIDISLVNKQTLRSRITFLAQEPTLFPGSLRHNLDPTEAYSVEAAEAVLARISSASKSTSTLIGGQPWTLATVVESGGRNLSHGQRQLVGLARAILRRSAIVIMDEATASIDGETAWEVQRLLREELSESTVVTIAHRAEAVNGVKNCLVLAKGRVIAQGALGEVSGVLGGMGSASGSGTATPRERE